MRTILLSSVALALTACSPPASGPRDEAGQSTQSPPAATASAADAMQMRLGRWNKTITVMGRKSTEAECITSADLNQMATEPNSHCNSANGFQRSAEGLVYEAECTGEDGGGHIRTVLNGDMQNHYVADMTMTASGNPGEMKIHIEGTYEGACRGDE